MKTIIHIILLLSVSALSGCVSAGESNITPLVKTQISGWVVYSSLVSREPFVTQIFLKNLESGEVSQLTHVGNNGWPRWSPDGKQILYLSWTKENSDDIYLMDKDGNNQRPIVASTASETMADWSPDGSKIVYISNKDGNDEIYVMDMNLHTSTRLTNSSAIESSPKWSSTGKQIAFISNVGRSGRSQIFAMNAGGTDVKQLTEYNLDNFDDSPVWCPDDSCIVFTRFVMGVPKLMLLDLASKNTTLLLDGIFVSDVMETHPGRSPRSGYITFSVGEVFYVFDMKSRELYPLGIHALELSLYP